jgi:ParB family chromosome partitioning protein
MQKQNNVSSMLTSLDALFTTQEERDEAQLEKIRVIPLEELRPFKDHPFKVQNDEEMGRIIESVRTVGVLSPGLARPLPEGGYELVSGHRRMAACRAAGLTEMPVVVREMTDDEAVVAMVDSNLQREHLLPSEKAFAYKMKMEALTHRGKTCGQVGHKSRDAVAEEESGRQIQRYIRLTNLIPEILKMVDEERIALTPAVELSYLERPEQAALYRIMERNEVTPSVYQAKQLRQLSREEKLTDEVIGKLISEPKANQKEYVRVPCEQLRRFFPRGATPMQMQETLLRAMEYYRQHSRASTDREAR